MFEFLIDTLEGEPLLADLENIGACYPDDDVIYIFGIPCRLSSARNVAAQQSAQPTLPESHDLNVYCPLCGGQFDIELSASQSGLRKSFGGSRSTHSRSKHVHGRR